MICEAAHRVDIRTYGQNPPRELRHRGQRIDVTHTNCHFGGRRWWFLCPGCKRRCAILYPTLCRLCRALSYRSMKQSPADRRLEKAIALRKRLGQSEGGVLVPFPQKPKYMHWHTYFQLRLEALKEEAIILDRFRARMPRLPTHLSCSREDDA